MASLSAYRLASEKYHVVVELLMALLASPITALAAYPYKSMVGGVFSTYIMLSMKRI